MTNEDIKKLLQEEVNGILEGSLSPYIERNTWSLKSLLF